MARSVLACQLVKQACLEVGAVSEAYCMRYRVRIRVP
jgi:hypothetical protein